MALAQQDGSFTPNPVIDRLRGLTAHIPGFSVHARLVVSTFAEVATGMVEDTEDLRDALAARLDDPDAETRLEAVHGLALRGDPRAVEPALELLAAAERSEGDGMWRRLELRETAQRLAAQTGDERFAPYLPA